MDGHRLVPRDAPYASLSHRVLVAVDDEPFILEDASRALAPMLAAWPAAFTVALVRAPQAQRSQLALADVNASGLISPAIPLKLYEEVNGHPATDVLQAIAETRPIYSYSLPDRAAFWASCFIAASRRRCCATAPCRCCCCRPKSRTRQHTLAAERITQAAAHPTAAARHNGRPKQH